MGYSLTTLLARPTANSHASPKTHTPGSRLQERGLRYYSANLARWVSRDPIEEGGGLSLYAMVDNGPVNTTDPLGLMGRPDLCCCCPESIEILNVKPVKPGWYPAGDPRQHKKAYLFGHEFDVKFTVKYVRCETSKADCTFKWWEKTDKPIPILVARGAKADTWYDAYDLWNGKKQVNPMFAPWDHRLKQCPGCDLGPNQKPIHDTPRMDVSIGKRYLLFVIQIQEGAGCECEKRGLKKEVQVEATQTLEWDAANQKATKQDFDLSIDAKESLPQGATR
jgi:RHS repeat-associated protein